jgi:hypothetical protein
MKKLILILSFIICFDSAKAQTWEEWFDQNDAQIKYLREQIAALQAYGKVIAKGYAIVDDGLTLIGDIKNGDFSLHKNYFSSLSSVESVVRNDYRGKQIKIWYESIKKSTTTAFSTLNFPDVFIAEDATYIRSVLSRLLKEGLFIKQEAERLLSENNYVLKDDERLQRLKELYQAMEERYVFSKHFSATVKSLMVQRARDSKNYLLMEKLYSLH